MIISGYDCWKRTGLSRLRKLENVGAETTSSGSPFQIRGPETLRVLLPTADSRNIGTPGADVAWCADLGKGCAKGPPSASCLTPFVAFDPSYCFNCMISLLFIWVANKVLSLSLSLSLSLFSFSPSSLSLLSGNSHPAPLWPLGTSLLLKHKNLQIMSILGLALG